MGDAQSVPVVGEAVTIIESGSKIVAAGACAIVGQTDTAEKLANGAGNSWKEYSEKNLIAGAVNCVVKKAQGRDAEAERIADKALHSFEGFVDSVPVVGHTKGVVHYIAGDTEHGNKCMFNATRSTAVMGAGALTGGLGGGAVLGGLVGIETGIVYDGAASAVKEEPTGCIRAIGEAVTSGDPNKVIDAGLGFAGDFAGGYSGAQFGEAIRIKYEQAALEKAYQNLKKDGKMPRNFDPEQATSDTINAARQLDKQVKDGVVKRDGHVSSKVRNLETNEVSQGYNARARADMNVAEFEKHGTDSGYRTVTNAKKSGFRGKTKLQRNPDVQQAMKNRNPASCAEHDAFNSYMETPGAHTAHAQVVSVQYLDGSYTTVMRCPNCKQYAMGRVPTDLVAGKTVPVASACEHVTTGCECGLMRAQKNKTKTKDE